MVIIDEETLTLEQRLAERVDRKWETFSWVTLRALSSSFNDVLGKGAPRLVTELRKAWLERSGPPAVVELPTATSFIVMGDPGEQDASQYAVAGALEANDDADFMIVCSDVIYPAGDVNDYVDGFYVPYSRVDMEVYALPGNHDWYDALFGFMWNFCKQPDPVPPPSSAGYTLRERLAKLLWRSPKRPGPTIQEWAQRPCPQVGSQPGPYFAIDLPDLRLVCIDTGIAGTIDDDQGEWLLGVSKEPVDKILLTGKPLLVDNASRPCAIEGAGAGDFATVDEIVRFPEHRYVATIGGDVHNHQRYVVETGGERRIHYLVSGGGGAYLSATHTIPTGPPAGATIVGEPAFYPTREASLQHFARLFVPPTFRIVLRTVLAVLGVVLAVLAVRVLEPAEETLERALAVSAGLVGAWMVATFLRPLRVDSLLRYRGLEAVSLVAGVAIGLAGWWLAPAQFATNTWAVGALALGGLMTGYLLRVTAWWRAGRSAPAILIVWALAGSAGTLVLALAGEYRLAAAAGLVTVAGLVGGILRARPSLWRETPAAVVAGLVQCVVVLLVIYDWPVREAGVEAEFNAIVTVITAVVVAFALMAALSVFARLRFAVEIALDVTILAITCASVWMLIGERVYGPPVLTAVLALAVPVALALLVDRLRNTVPGRWLYKPVFLVLVGGVAVALGLLVPWAVEGAIGATVVFALAVILVTLAHLLFLGALTLLVEWDCIGGKLDGDEARAGLRWRDGDRSARPGRRVKQIVNIVHPGSKRPHGPLHKLAAEICDTDVPPFAKNFLRLDVEGKELKIRLFKITGDGQPASEEIVAPITLKARGR